VDEVQISQNVKESVPGHGYTESRSLRQIPNVPFSVRVPSSITDPTRSSVQELSLHTTRNVFFLF
ncbi:hypothetical protein LSH36_571g03118, partial [Paralvinella palmiformis]